MYTNINIKKSFNYVFAFVFVHFSGKRQLVRNSNLVEWKSSTYSKEKAVYDK